MASSIKEISTAKPDTLDPPRIVVLSDEISQDVLVAFEVEPGVTVSQWVESSQFDITTTPMMFLFNGVPLLEKDWDTTRFHQGCVLTLVGQPGFFAVIGWVAFAIAMAATAYSLYTIFTMPDPDSLTDGSGTYSISYRGNRTRRDQPRIVSYGTMMVYGDLIGQYSVYVDNDQWMYQLFELTVGETDVIADTDVWFQDTPLTNFDGYEFEYVPVGSDSKIFPMDEIISTDVNNIDVNDAGATPYYVTSPVGEPVSAVFLDIAFPSGFYRIDSDGDLEQQGLGLEIAWRRINDSGGFIDGGGVQVTIWGDGTNPVRQTLALSENINSLPNKIGDDFIAGARYEVAINRTTPSSPESNISNNMVWERLRATGLLPASDTLATRIAIKIRNSTSAGNQTLSQFRALVKRKIPTWNGSWSAPVATNSSVWAFCDVIMNSTYGMGLADTHLDLAALKALDDRNDPLTEFNGVFDTGTDAWKTLNEIARMHFGTAVELAGNKYTIVPDDENVAPTMLVGQDRVVSGSFGIEHKTLLSLEYDYVVATFKDSAQDYRDNTVEAVPFGVPQAKAKEVFLRGPVTRDAAWRIAIRLANEHRWRRKAITFRLGLDGMIPAFGSTLQVAHYLLDIEGSPRGYSGAIKSASGGTITVYEDLTTLIGQGNLYVFVRDSDGSPIGPVSASVSGKHTISSGISVPSWNEHMPNPTFALGGATDFITTMKVSSVQTVGEHLFEIGGFEDNPNVYIEDAPPTFKDLADPASLVPTVTGLTGDMYGDTGKARVRLAWVGKNSDYYVIDISTDSKVTWNRISRTNDEFWDGPVPQENNLWMRVIGVGLVFGPPAEIGFNVADYLLTLPTVKGLKAAYAFNHAEAAIEWVIPPPDHKIEIDVKWNGAVKQTLTEIGRDVNILRYTWWYAYSIDPMTIDGITWPNVGCREMTFDVHVTDLVGNRSLPETITLKNRQMDYLVNASYEEKGTDLVINFTWPNTDYSGVDVHMSTTQGFTPDLTDGSTTRVYRGGESNITIRGVLVHPNTYYMVMAGYDIWNPLDDLNFSVEVEISTTDDSVGGPIEWDDIVGDNKPEDNAQVNQFSAGITMNQAVFGGPYAEGWVLIFGYKNGAIDNSPAYFDYNGQKHWVGVDGSSDALGINCRGTVETQTLGGLIAHDTSGGGKIGGNNTGLVFWLQGAWLIQNETPGLTAWVDYDDPACILIGGVDIVNNVVVNASVWGAVSVQTYDFLYSTSLWGNIYGEGKPADYAEVNAWSAGITRNQAAFGGPTVLGSVFIHGYHNNVDPINAPGVFTYESARVLIGPVGIACLGPSPQVFLAHDTSSSSLIGGANTAPVYWYEGTWYLQTGAGQGTPWTEHDNAACILFGAVDLDSGWGTQVTQATVWNATAPSTYNFLLSHALWADVGDPAGTKPEDNADVSVDKIGATKNQQTFGGPTVDGWLFIHGYTGGAKTNTAGVFHFNAVKREIGPGAIDCRGGNHEGFLAVDMYSNGHIGGANSGMVYWDQGTWYLQSNDAQWTDSNREDVCLIGGINVSNNRISEVSLWSATAVETYHFLLSHALWDDVGDPTTTKPRDNADPNTGSGWNSFPAAYHTFNNDEYLPATHGSVEIKVQNDSGIFGEAAMRYETNGNSNTNITLATTTSTYNIALEPGAKWIVSFWAVSTAQVSSRMLFKSSASNYYGAYENIQNMGSGGRFVVTTAWTQFVGVMDLTSVSESKFNCILYNEGSTDTYFDGLHIERLRRPPSDLSIDDYSGFAGTPKHSIKTDIMIPDAATNILHRERGTDLILYEGDADRYWAESSFSFVAGNVVTYRAVMSFYNGDGSGGSLASQTPWPVYGQWVVNYGGGDQLASAKLSNTVAVSSALANYGQAEFVHSFVAGSTETDFVIKFYLTLPGMDPSGGYWTVATAGSFYELRETKR